jgi:hypothetical protein
MALERLAARIHHDELGAALGRLLEKGRGDRMVLGGIGADDDDDVGVLAFVEGCSDRSRPNTFEQSRHRRGMAQPGAMIDIVGAETGAHQLLEQVSLFVGAFGRAEAGQRLRPVAVADFLQTASGAVERFLPSRFAEVSPGIRRIDIFMRDFWHAVLADHRLEQALRIGHVIEAEASFHAKPVLIGRPALAGDGNDLVVFDLIGELAADPTIGTHAVDGAVRFTLVDVVLVHHRRRHQSSGWASLHAFTASDAGRRAHRIVEVEHDLFAVAAAGHADDVVDLHLAAGTDAKIALDASIEINRHGRMAAVRRRAVPLWEAAFLKLHTGHDLPQLGRGIVGMGLIGLVGDQ